MSVRPLDPNRDLDAVMRIWLDSNIDAHPFVEREHWEGALYEARLAVESSEAYVFEDAPGDIAGFISIEDDDVSCIFVREGRRGEGIGHLLMDGAKASHRALDIRIFIQNPRAFSFCKREGFDQHGVKPDPSTSKMQAMMHWSGELPPIEIPDNIEELLATVREEAGESMYQSILDDIRNGNIERR